MCGDHISFQDGHRRKISTVVGQVHSSVRLLIQNFEKDDCLDAFSSHSLCWSLSINSSQLKYEKCIWSDRFHDSQLSFPGKNWWNGSDHPIVKTPSDCGTLAYNNWTSQPNQSFRGFVITSLAGVRERERECLLHFTLPPFPDLTSPRCQSWRLHLFPTFGDCQVKVYGLLTKPQSGIKETPRVSVSTHTGT